MAGPLSRVHLCMFEVYLCTNTCTIYVHSQMPDLNTQSKYKCPRKNENNFAGEAGWRAFLFFLIGLLCVEGVVQLI